MACARPPLPLKTMTTLAKKNWPQNLVLFQSFKMTSTVGSVVYLSCLWTSQPLAVILTQLIKSYLRSKPPVAQTLLDKTHLLLLSSFQATIVQRSILSTIYHLEINLDDPQATVISWINQAVNDFWLFAALAVNVTNILSVYCPWVIDVIDEQTFEWVLIIGTFTPTLGTTLAAWYFDWCNLAYHFLRQVEGVACEPFNPLRFTFLILGFTSTVGFKLSLTCTRNILSEGERNLFNSKVILSMSFPLIVIKALTHAIPNMPALVVLVTMNFYVPAFPLMVMYFSENVKSYAWRKIGGMHSAWIAVLVPPVNMVQMNNLWPLSSPSSTSSAFENVVTCCTFTCG